MRTIAALLGLACLVLAGPSVAQNMCIDKGSWQRMADRLGMALTAEATMKDGGGSIAFYLMTDDKGGWQTFYTRDGLMMCMLVGGEDWTPVKVLRGDPA